MKRHCSRFFGLGFSSVNAVKNVRLMDAVGGGARIERVDDVIRLAEPERQADHQIGPDVTDDILGDRLGVGEQFWHQYPV